MRAYSCKVLLAGNLLNQVPKILTAPEIQIMRWLHGGDAVIDISLYSEDYAEFKGVRRWTQQDERDRLQAEYDQYLKAERNGRNPTSVDQMFGMFNALPEALPEGLLDEELDDDEYLAREEIIAQSNAVAEKVKRPKDRPTNKPAPAPVEIVDA